MRQHAVLMIKNFGTACFILFASAAAMPIASAEMADNRTLSASLTQKLCARQVNASEFMKAGVFDSQITISQIIPKTPQDRLKESALREQAQRRAGDNKNLGYAYGMCEDGSAWIASMPAPGPIALRDNVLEIPARVAAACEPKSLQIRYAHGLRGRSMIVPQKANGKDDRVADIPGVRGVIAVSCVLKKFNQEGPRELAMLPVAGFDLNDKELKLASVSSALDAMDWINAKRTEASLPPFEVSPSLNDAALSSVGTMVIRHNFKTLTAITPGLLKAGITPIGENRVIASNWSEAVALLWSSPFHRDLLLNANADLVGIAQKSFEQGQIIVTLIAGQKTSGAVSRLVK